MRSAIVAGLGLLAMLIAVPSANARAPVQLVYQHCDAVKPVAFVQTVTFYDDITMTPDDVMFLGPLPDDLSADYQTAAVSA